MILLLISYSCLYILMRIIKWQEHRMRKTNSAKDTKIYRKNTSVVHRHSVHRDTFSPVGSLQEKLFSDNFCFLIFSKFQLLQYHSSMHFWWRFILASYLQTLFLRSSGRQDKPLGFHNIMFCLFLLFFRGKSLCLPCFVFCVFILLLYLISLRRSLCETTVC